MVCPWKIEIIPDEDNVLRQVHVKEFQNEPKRRFPNEAHFDPYPDGLSVHWETYCNVENVHIIIGISISPNSGKFLDTTQFKVLRFNTGFLRKIDGVEDVIHDPVFNGDPSPKGKPNNKSHSLVKYPDTNLKIRVELSDWVGNNYETIFCKPKFKEINKVIEELKIRV